MFENFDENAYKQAYVIINYLVNSGEIVISQEFINKIEQKMNKDYYFDLNDIKSVKILPDTEKILAVVYLEYILSEKERTKVSNFTSKLKKIIVKEEKQEIGLITQDLSELSVFEKLKVKFNKLLAQHQ